MMVRKTWRMHSSAKNTSRRVDIHVHRKNKMKTHIHQVIKITIAILLLTILTWATLRNLAAWHFQTAQNTYTSIINTTRTTQNTQTKINQANSQLSQALKYFPNNPDYLDLAGLLQELQSNQPGVVGKTHRQALEKAAAYYRKALAQRPLWPYSWANLLAVKDKLGELDDEFHLALQRAVETGPWEPRVQLQVLRTGLKRWDRLAASERGMVRETIAHALRKQPREAFLIIRSYARPDLVCDRSGDYVQIKRWCEEVLDSSQG